MTVSAEITQDQFEDWLFDICPVFSRGEDRKKRGLSDYEIPLSDLVSISVRVIFRKSPGRWDGRCLMRLQSRRTGRRLGRRDANNQKPSRTTEWREEWKTTLEALMDAYVDQKKAIDEDACLVQAVQAKTLLPLIERVPGWEDDFYLGKCHKLLKQGRWLTPYQEDRVRRPQKKASKKRARKKA